jgi:hypothetical protein
MIHARPGATHRIHVVGINTITSLVLGILHSSSEDRLDVLDTSRSREVEPPCIPISLLVVGRSTDSGRLVSRGLALSAVAFRIEE